MRSDIQAKIEELLKPLNKVSKSWRENLSMHLDEFMSCIAEFSADDDDVGLTASNFVQAGVMIENAARIYSLNVDFVWQCMNEVLEDMQTNKKSNTKSSTEGMSSENAEEVVRKRRRKVVCENFEEFVPRVIDPDMKSNERNQTITPLPISRCTMGKSDWKRRKRPYEVFDMEEDTLDPSEYGVMYQTSVFGKLQLNMLKEMIEDKSNGEHSIPELIYTLRHLCAELSLTVIDSSSEYSSSSQDDRSPTPSVEEIIGSPTTLTVLVTPPPSPLTVKRSNSASIETPSAIKRSMSDADSEKEVCAGGLTTKNSREHVVTITRDSWVPDPLENDLNEKNLQKKSTLSLLPGIKPLKPEERKRKPCVKIIIQYVDVNVFYVLHKNRDLSATIFRRFYIQQNRKKKVILKEHSRISFSIKPNLSGLHKSLSQNLTTDFSGFEDFEADPGEENGFCGFPDNEEQNLNAQSCTCVDSEGKDSGNVGTCIDSEGNDSGNVDTCIDSEGNDSGSVGTGEKSCTCVNSVGSDNVGSNEKSCTCVNSVGSDNVGNSEKSCTCVNNVGSDNVGNSEKSCTCVNSVGSDNVGNSEKSCSCANNVGSDNVGNNEKSCTCVNNRVEANVGNSEVTCSIDNSSVNNCENLHEEAVLPAPIEDTPCTDSEEPCCSNDFPVQSPILESEKSCQHMLERVIEWERFIRPKLKQAHERGNFDIHGLGSEILESFPDCTSGTVMDFHQFLLDKPRVDVARYFVASLQLANSCNVEILQSEPGDLAMDCMQLKLISSVRPHESLEDYEAPSEGARRKRKRQCIQEMSSDSDSDSEVNCKVKRKRNKR